LHINKLLKVVLLFRSVKVPAFAEHSKWVLRGFYDEVYFCIFIHDIGLIDKNL